MKLIKVLTALTLTCVSVVADIKDDVRQLSREKFKLTMATVKIFNQHKLNENAEYVDLQKKALAASREFNQVRRSHPGLKEHYANSDAAQKKMVQARMNKDKEASRKAMSEFTQSRMDMEKAAAGIPELKEIQQKAIAANKASEDKKLELLESIPEGKAHAEKIKALESKIAELRKQMKLAQP